MKQYDQKIPADLGTSFLNIRTDSAVGSDERMVMWFYQEDRAVAGSFYIHFSGTVDYLVGNCASVTSYTAFPTILPEEKNKEWVIEKRGRRVRVYCNGKEVLDVTVTAELCDSYADWDETWGREADYVHFPSKWDAASDSIYIGW